MKKPFCPICEGGMYKKGKSSNGKQRWKCRNCGHRTVRPLWKTRKTNDVKTEYTEKNNHGVVDIKTGRITSLEQLLKSANVDLKAWDVDRYVINKWEVGSKTPSGEVKVEPLFQVKAWLKKKIPTKTVFPPIQKVVFGISAFKANLPKRKSKIKKALIIPDSQNGYKRDIYSGKLEPFHDRRAWDIMVQVAKHIEPDVIVMLGDMLDLPDWSDKYLRSPEFYWTTQPALIELAWWIGQLRQVSPNSEIVYLEGNHEKRLREAVIRHLISAYDLRPADEIESPPVLSIDNLIGLSRMGVKFIGEYPDSEYWINDNLRARHGKIAKSGNTETVKVILRNTRTSEIVGHVHRYELASKTTFGKRGKVVYTVMSPGTIARIDGTVPAYSKENDWQQGFALVNYEEGNGRFDARLVSINEGVALLDDLEFVGNDNVEKLKEDTKWEYF